MRITSARLHQLLHIGYPEAYQAAVAGSELWVSLRLGGKPLEKLAPTPTRVKLVETPTSLVAKTGVVSWRVPDARWWQCKDGLPFDQIGWAISRYAEPFYLHDRPIIASRKVTVTVTEMTWEIRSDR